MDKSFMSESFIDDAIIIAKLAPNVGSSFTRGYVRLSFTTLTYFENYYLPEYRRHFFE